MLVLLVLSLLLLAGFTGTREWRRLAEDEHMINIMRGWDGVAWFAWLGIAPGILVLIRRFPLTRDGFWGNLSRILVWSIVLYFVVAHVRFFFDTLTDIARGANWRQLLDLDAYAYNTFAMMPLDFLTYCGFFAVTFSVNYYYEHHRRTEEAVQLHLQAAEMQSELTRAELTALRSQLHPHFIFNSFNALATLIRQGKNDEAVETIARLSALLRLAIDRTELAEITLEQELDYIRNYLAIEQMRFGDKLQVEFKVAPALLDALVPNIVLQPLVENAIKHGIALRTNPGILQVAVMAHGDRLRFEVFNDGPDGAPALGPDPAARRGIGMANARRQLEKLYGVDYLLEILSPAANQTLVRLDVPLRRAADAPLA